MGNQWICGPVVNNIQILSLNELDTRAKATICGFV